MPDAQFDIELIKTVLREATEGAAAPFSQRGLAKAAGETRDAVGDIINGRNKNPTSKVLANLARAMNGDLSMFGLSEARVEPPTVGELEAALRDMLPGMPKGSPDKRARYLAESVGHALKLPQDPPAIAMDRPSIATGEAAPLPAPTN